MHRPGRPAFNVELPDLPPRSLSESPAYQDGQSDSEPLTDSSVYSLVLSPGNDDTSVSVVVASLLETKSRREVTASGKSDWRRPGDN